MTMVSGSAAIGAKEAWSAKGFLQVHDAPTGADAMAIADAARSRGGLVVHVARDAAHASTMVDALRFFAPDIPIVDYPAWDCLPYDRVSPSSTVTSRRMATLALLAERDADAGALIIVTSVNAVLQRTPPRDVVLASSFTAKPGEDIPSERITAYLAANGYTRASTVREAGEFAVRGGLIDIFPPGADEPVRLDFFGDTLESIRAFDAETQRTTRQRTSLELAAANEVLLTEETISRFRKNYIATFGPAQDDPVYEAVSAGRIHAGMEHWLPLFYGTLDRFFDFTGDALVFTEYLVDEAAGERFSAIADYYNARHEDLTDPAENARKRQTKSKDFAAPKYRPLKPEALYLGEDDWANLKTEEDVRALTPFSPAGSARAFSLGAKVGRNFGAERSAEKNVFAALAGHINALGENGKKPVIACWSEGSADRMRTVLADQGVETIAHAESFKLLDQESKAPATVILGLDAGFETRNLAFIAEADILGDRLVRKARRKRADNFLTEASSLSVGDLVVHVDHGIGRYEGLEALEIQSAPHDCLLLVYAGGDKLYLPVENIDLLSRFGSDDSDSNLDKLGGAAWQGRKAKMKQRIRMMAEALIKIAAQRAMKSSDEITPPSGAYDEFCARFPYAETDDQLNAIADVTEDLAKGQPMDRLICGDVGFGKTEVALRAAFIVAMSGRQVAVIAPTTLLARQHYKNFSERFKGFPIKIGQLSRMVGQKTANDNRAGMASGDLDIVIGTHALLAKSVSFNDLGMIVVDEEQRFGVKHKERLKEYRADTHVLTLTATPIPRTLQLAMTGIRDLSLISTPPIDRLAVRTTVGPFDPLVAREVLLREHYRGGQSFYVVPRIDDLTDVAEFLDTQVPEIRYKTAHGQLAAGELEDIMTAFYEGQFDVLVATTIIESGLDIPAANTLVVHKADLFGLAQLYQIRGRVGRSKQRAYAYLTVPARKK